MLCLCGIKTSNLHVHSRPMEMNFLGLEVMNLKLDLLNKFQVPGKVSSKALKYVSFDISQYNDKITFDQIHCINSIKPIPINHELQSQNQEKWNDSEPSYYLQLVEKLNWVYNQSRLDFCFDVCLLSSTKKTL